MYQDFLKWCPYFPLVDCRIANLEAAFDLALFFKRYQIVKVLFAGV